MHELSAYLSNPVPGAANAGDGEIRAQALACRRDLLLPAGIPSEGLL